MSPRSGPGRLAMNMALPPSGAACYFCLGEEADDEGSTLVRDCSCRGDSAGFAHFSCLVNYAKQKCILNDSFSEPWKICNICKQPFQGQLSIDLASAFVSFAEATYGHEGNNQWDKLKVLSSLSMKIELALSRDDKETVKVDSKKMLSIIDHTTEELKMSGWIHMPKYSEEYKYNEALCGNYEAFAHIRFAMGSLDGSDDSNKVAIGNLEKARAIYNLFDRKDKVKFIDSQISVLNAMLQKANPVTNSFFQVVKNCYERDLKSHGMNSAVTIDSGLNYARIVLSPAFHHIEAERLATQVVTASRRIHGSGHKITREAEMFLNECKERHVSVLPDDKPFQALRYENEGEICVVTGPITKPRKVEDENLHHIANNLVIPTRGCVVICHGLVSASHLNGELGDVRDVKKNETGIRLAVHFEKKKGAKSALVKPENLRIAFELPDEVV